MLTAVTAKLFIHRNSQSASFDISLYYLLQILLTHSNELLKTQASPSLMIWATGSLFSFYLTLILSSVFRWPRKLDFSISSSVPLTLITTSHQPSTRTTGLCASFSGDTAHLWDLQLCFLYLDQLFSNIQQDHLWRLLKQGLLKTHPRICISSKFPAALTAVQEPSFKSHYSRPILFL